MYAVVAMIVWPRRDGSPSGQRPARWATAAWAAAWLGGAMLQLLPGNDTNASLGMAVSMNASGAPGWLAGLDHHLSALVPYDGISLVLDLVVLQAVVGLAVLAGYRTRRAAVLGGIVLSLAFWVTGQGLGQFWSGISTDPNTAPLLILLGVTVLGAGPWRPPALQAGTRIVDQGRSSPSSRSLPFFDRSGSVHAERLKQQGRLFPFFIFEMLTSTRRVRVSGLFVALTQRTHSQRAIGVISSHRFWIFCGAVARAVARSWGTLGSGQSLVTSMSMVAVSPARMPAACCSASSTLIQWPELPSGSSTVENSTPLIVPWTATCPREGRSLLAVSGNRSTVDVSIADSVASKRMAAASVR
jgi:uncharacterized membrane protein YphA (DoxX/SURF4 family)